MRRDRPVDPRVLRRLYVLAALLPVVAGGIVAALLLRPAEAPSAAATAGPFRGSEPPGSLRAPRFALPDQSGATVSMDRLRGRAVLVTFLDTKCTDSCPVVAGILGAALARLPAGDRARVVALGVSVNPNDDTRASIGTFLRRHRLTRLHYLVAPAASMRPVWRAFHVVPAIDTGDSDVHSIDVRLFDPRGRWVSTFHTAVDLTPANVVHDVRVALARS